MSSASQDASIPPRPFRCEVALERDRASLRPIGALDMATVPILAAELARLRQAGSRHITFDLRGLNFVDSSGLHFFLESHTAARQDGFTIALIPGPPAVQRLFEITATTAVLPFLDT